MISGGFDWGSGLSAGAGLIGGIADAFTGGGDKTPTAFFDKNKWLAMALMGARMNMPKRRYATMPSMPASWGDAGNAAALMMAKRNNPNL